MMHSAVLTSFHFSDRMLYSDCCLYVSVLVRVLLDTMAFPDELDRRESR